MANKQYIVSELDFDNIKASLSAFIANNSDFTDYNFEGSGLSFLTDILAYNTHYNAVYLNMALNENFIDTASTRSSIVSLAKSFGYIPKSKSSSKMKVSFTVSGYSPSEVVTLTDTVSFTGTNSEGKSYIFYPVEQISVVANNSGVATFEDVELREGNKISIQYVSDGDSSQKFYINSMDLDISSVKVRVKESPNVTSTTTYELLSDILSVNNESNIFYLFETNDRKYSIQFGDGVFGTKLTAGNVVIIEYQTSVGEDANGIPSLSNNILSVSGFNTTPVFTNIVQSYGGAAEESVESIRVNALQNFRTQGRAVTADDYKYFISRDYPLAQTISVWGGQDNEPPIYGKVFISFKPADGFFLSNQVKENILNDIIKSKNIVSIIPEIVDPTYLFLEIYSTVKYNPRLTTLSASDIKAKVVKSIENYTDNTLTKFGTSFNYSKFTTNIDDTDTSIIGNITSIKLRKNVQCILNKALQYRIEFQNPIHPGTIVNKYSFKCENDSTLNNYTGNLSMEDDENGNIRIYYANEAGDKVILKNNAGEVNYNKGIVILNDFKPSQVNFDNTFDVVANPSEYSIGDVNSYRNTILTILDSDITVGVQVY